ncbi:MAG: transposase [Myxococcota bacterium]|jgi:transposase
MAEILDENTHLRAASKAQLARIAALTEQARTAAEVASKRAADVELLTAKNTCLTDEVERLTKHFEFLAKKRKLAAAERYIAAKNQEMLFSDASVTVPARDAQVEAADAVEPEGDRRKTPKHSRKGRRKLEDTGFPKKVVTAPVEAGACDACGGDRESLDPRVSFRLEWESGRHVVLETRHERCACPHCPEQGVWTAPEPYLLPNAMCGDGLLAKVIVDRFADHLPFNRQAKRMTREGLRIGTNVLAGWSRQGAREVRPLVKAVVAQIASGTLLQSDDSGFPVQDGSDGRLAKGRMWVFTDQRQAFFAFSRTKAGEHPADLLEGLGASGRLIADGGSEYNEVVRRLGLERGGCWAHARRYFHDAAVQHNTAKVALTAIRDLFMIERDLATSSKEARLSVRATRSKPIVDELYTWARELGPAVRPKSKLAEAIGYLIGQEPGLRVFLRHGDVPIHNNLSERLLRQPIVGRKNWLFAGSEGGAEAAMGWFTLIGSCMLQGVDPAEYLYDVFRRLPTYSSAWVHGLTPLNWRIRRDAGDFVPLLPGQLK